MISPKYAPILAALILSGVMSCLVSGIATFRALGPVEGFVGLWMIAWLNAWAVAFPTLMLVGPVARRLVARITRDE